MKRLLISVLMPFMIFLWRCSCVWVANKAVPVAFGRPTSGPEWLKTFARVGWDLSSVSLGFFITALVDGTARYGQISGKLEVGDQHLLAGGSSILFLFCYTSALLVRFSLLEAWAQLDRVHCFLYGIISWVLGSFMVLVTLALATKSAE